MPLEFFYFALMCMNEKGVFEYNSLFGLTFDGSYFLFASSFGSSALLVKILTFRLYC